MSLTYQTTVCNWLNKEWRDLSDLEATLLHKLPQYQLYYKDFSDLKNHRECKKITIENVPNIEITLVFMSDLHDYHHSTQATPIQLCHAP